MKKLLHYLSKYSLVDFITAQEQKAAGETCQKLSKLLGIPLDAVRCEWKLDGTMHHAGGKTEGNVLPKQNGARGILV